MKIVILSSTSLDTFQQEVLQPIVGDPLIEIVAAFIDCRPKPSAKKRFLKNLKRGRGGYMIVMLFKSFFAQQESTVSAKEFFMDRDIPVIESNTPYAKETIQQLQLLLPETMVMIGGFGIVKEPLLSLAPQGILSYHHGDMRKYRGQPVGFWELYNNETEMGVTVQRLSAGIDRGTPVVEKCIPINHGDTVSSLRKRAMSASTEMMHEALHVIHACDYRPTIIDAYGPVYTLPNLRQYLFLKLKILFRR